MRNLYRRVWRCQVYDSGYHNGCHCSEQDPHQGWDCGWVYKAPVLTDTEVNRAFVEKLDWFVQEVTVDVGV